MYCRGPTVHYRDISTLIRDNMDYLVDRVSLNLRYLESNPTTPDVLRVIINERYVALSIPYDGGFGTALSHVVL